MNLPKCRPGESRGRWQGELFGFRFAQERRREYIRELLGIPSEDFVLDTFPGLPLRYVVYGIRRARSCNQRKKRSERRGITGVSRTSYGGKKMKRCMSLHWVLAVTFLLAISFTLTGCATEHKAYKPAGAVECTSDIAWDVAKEAEVTKFKCYVDKYNKVDSVHYLIGIKNKTDKPQRYRVNIFIPEGKAVGGLVPEMGKPPVVAFTSTSCFSQSSVASSVPS